jgi:hypothetical protein
MRVFVSFVLFVVSKNLQYRLPRFACNDVSVSGESGSSAVPSAQFLVRELPGYRATIRVQGHGIAGGGGV